MKRLLLVLALLPVLGAISNAAAEDSQARALMQQVAARDEGRRQQARVEFILTPGSGAAQVRIATAYREQDSEGRRLALYFESPRSLRRSSFLSWDLAASGDDRWLYLPALRRARRIPAAERGGYFLGTDLTYDDMRHFGKVDLADYRFVSMRALPGEADLWEVEGVPLSADIQAALGYSRGRWVVDARQHFVRTSDYQDAQGERLKTIEYDQWQILDGILTANRITVRNHKTGHRTELRFSSIVNDADFPAKRLSPQGLERGG